MRMRIAILDDYQEMALKLADWSSIPGRPEIKVFTDHVFDLEKLAERLLPYDILCIMRERTPMTAALIERLPNLKLIASTGARNAAIDLEAAGHRHVDVVYTGYSSTPTIEFTWAMILAVARQITIENASLRSGGWQRGVGSDLRGKALAVLGLGNVGGPVAAIGKAFGMRVIAWSPNLTRERAESSGAQLVSKAALFREADFLTVHLVLSPKTRGIVGAAELGWMKSSSYLINTSRGPLIEETSLIKALEDKKIAGFAVDVFEQEPLPVNHPFRRLTNVLATPHIGFGSLSLYETFYRDSVKNITNWILHSKGRDPR
jgi:phosphoglycerate dehydrogenase-like enzyme